MSLSLIAKSIGESATLRLNEVAAILRAKGDPVIHLGGGEPKGKAPLDAILAASNLINSGEVRYTPPDGIPAQRPSALNCSSQTASSLDNPSGPTRSAKASIWAVESW